MTTTTPAKMTNEAKAALLLRTAINFMARKNGVTEATVVRALELRAPNAVRQFAELVPAGIVALAND